MAALAREDMFRVCAGRRPRIVSLSVTRTALAAPVAEVDLAVHMQRGLVTARARARGVSRRRRSMTITTFHRRIRPHRRGSEGSFAGVAAARARARRRVERSLRQPDLHVSVAMRSVRRTVGRCRMTARARDPGRARRARLDVRRVCAAALARKEADIARGIRLRRSVAGVAGEDTFLVTRRARRRTRRRGRRSARRSAVVTTSARVGVGEIQHRSPPPIAEKLPVSRGRAWIDERRSMGSAVERGCASGEPTGEERTRVGDARVARPGERAEELRVRTERDRLAVRTADRLEIRAGAKATRGCRPRVAARALCGDERRHIVAVRRNERRAIGNTPQNKSACEDTQNVRRCAKSAAAADEFRC